VDRKKKHTCVPNVNKTRGGVQYLRCRICHRSMGKRPTKKRGSLAMRKATGTGYPHDNLSQGQREAIDRLYAPLADFVRSWTHVWLTDPLPEGSKGAMFYPRKRRTWTLYVHGYPVLRAYGRVVKE
jgi:hypothetical protein